VDHTFGGLLLVHPLQLWVVVLLLLLLLFLLLFLLLVPLLPLVLLLVLLLLLLLLPRLLIILVGLGVLVPSSATPYLLSLVLLPLLLPSLLSNRAMWNTLGVNSLPRMFLLASTNWVSFLGLLQITFYSVHWGACIFYYIARQYGFGPNTWVALNEDMLESKSTAFKYAPLRPSSLPSGLCGSSLPSCVLVLSLTCVL
jgi:hypothetical protein